MCAEHPLLSTDRFSSPPFKSFLNAQAAPFNRHWKYFHDVNGSAKEPSPKHLARIKYIYAKCQVERA